MIVLLVAPVAQAESLRLGSVFSDHMVIQQGRPTNLWGWADPGATVTVEIAGQKHEWKADDKGRWSGKLAPVAVGGPYTLVVSAKDSRVEVEDILAGELWLCSGQSNMAMPMRELPEEMLKQQVAQADYPQIRTVRIPEVPAEEARSETSAQWQICSPETLPGLTAEGYFFGRKLHQELKTPVGLLLCAWGGSSAHAWTSPESLDEPALARQMPHDVLGWRENVRPSLLYNGMLNPIVGTTVRGVIWHQGETEGDAGQNPYLYRLTFPAMISDWRKQWAEPEMPFYFVQLFNLVRHERWPVVRESQAEALKLPRTGMTVTVDLAEGNQLHPKTKEAFGNRMADLVLAREYGKSIGVDSPAYKSMQTQSGAIRIALDHAAGLKTTDGKSPAEFLIAGDDQKFVPAEVKIDGESLIISSPQVPQPAAVRYAWSGDPKVNLVNADGLPAAPFRTDTWPVVGQEAMWQMLPTRATLGKSTEAKRIVAGEADGWRWIGQGVKPDELVKRNMTRASENHVQLVVSERPARDLEMPSPALAWAFGNASDATLYDPGKGFTAEFKLQPYRFGAPTRGVELALNLRQPDKSIKRYRIEVAPMRVYGFDGDLVNVFGYNLNNTTSPGVYRIAVRPDGVAQVYLNDRPMGVLSGEALKDAPADLPLISWGKRVTSGLMAVNAFVVAFDTDGAFSPVDSTEKQ